MKSIKKNTREDGAETKARRIQCAGRLIADQGYDRTTSKDICRLAGVNMAAVNYHFGSREGLYQAVLDEVYHYVLSPVEIETIYHMDIGPREKLMKLLDLYVKEALFSESWQVKVGRIHQVCGKLYRAKADAGAGYPFQLSGPSCPG